MNDIEARAARKLTRRRSAESLPEPPAEEAYDSVTADLRPAAFDELKAENTTLATELEQMRAEHGGVFEENDRLREALRLQDADLRTLQSQFDDMVKQRAALARELEEVRSEARALAAELGQKLACLHTARDHIAADHTSMESAVERMNSQAEAIAELRKRRADLTEALSRSSDQLLIAIGERNEARRMYETANRDRAELLGALDAPETAARVAGQHERLTGGE